MSVVLAAWDRLWSCLTRPRRRYTLMPLSLKQRCIPMSCHLGGVADRGRDSRQDPNPEASGQQKC